MMIGMTRGTTRAHVARAALESIAFQSAELLVAMQADAASPLTELRVDGGAARNDLLMQFQADLVGVPVRTAGDHRNDRTWCCLSRRTRGWLLVGTDEIASLWRVERRFTPKLAAATRDALLADWKRAVERAKAGPRRGSVNEKREPKLPFACANGLRLRLERVTNARLEARAPFRPDRRRTGTNASRTHGKCFAAMLVVYERVRAIDRGTPRQVVDRPNRILASVRHSQ